MQVPNFALLRKERDNCRNSGQRCHRSSYASGVHSNPRFFKYFWWVFWNESPVDGDEFLTAKYRLSTAAATELVEKLGEQNEPYWLYNTKVPRLGSTIPFDPQSPQWQDIEWASAYDDDPDPVAEGDLAGHK